MTEIEIVKNGGEYRGFECHGHAGFKRSGKDVVCSAVSVLTINTVNSIDHLLEDEISVTTNEKEGDMQCYFLNKPSKEAKLLIDSMILGLESISAQYGAKYLKIVIKEV